MTLVTHGEGSGSRWHRQLTGAAVVLPLAGLALAGVAAAPAASASTTCQVINQSTHVSYGDLQQAIHDAASGATLFVSGICTGNFQIGSSLTLTGQQPAGSPAPTLNGGGNGTVLAITSGKVTINSLRITNGNSGQGSATAEDGGGIFNNANLKLKSAGSGPG